MAYPEVEVLDITSERDLLINTTVPQGVDLGGEYNLKAALAEDQLGAFERALRQGTQVFLLKWEGNKIPRGAQVLGHEITGTQNRQVLASGGKHIGSYDRLVEFGGESGNEQQMLVYIQPSAIRLDI